MMPEAFEFPIIVNDVCQLLQHWKCLYMICKTYKYSCEESFSQISIMNIIAYHHSNHLSFQPSLDSNSLDDGDDIVTVVFTETNHHIDEMLVIRLCYGFMNFILHRYHS